MTRFLIRPRQDTRLLMALGLFAFLAACGDGASLPSNANADTTGRSKAIAASVARYDGEGRLKFPSDYRRWVFLSSGHGMSYSPEAAPVTDPPFDNVFADPVSYEEFLQTGTWRDGTMLVLEIRPGQSKGSINRRGAFQSGEPAAVEVHVKDLRRFPSGWAFFSFAAKEPAPMIPTTAECYSCHQQNGAVNTTFVQFYPTLLPIAREKRTVLAAYLKSIAG